MAFLHTEIPIGWHCKIRKEYLYNLESYHGEYEDCWVVGLHSVQGWALTFRVLLPNGAMFDHMPLRALCSEECIDEGCLYQLWDCFSYDASAFELQQLRGVAVGIRDRRGGVHEGTYMFTVDWCKSPLSETPAEHKDAHIIKLNNGNYAALPNNRILWRESSWCTRVGEGIDYKTNSHRWSAEEPTWVAEDDNKQMYKGRDE